MEVFWLIIHRWAPSHGITCTKHHVLWQLEQPDISKPELIICEYDLEDTLELYGPFQKGEQKGIKT